MDAPHTNALLLFRVGPVLCAAPSISIQSIISPPKLTHPPGSSQANPGIFYHADHVVSVTDLRYQFGVDEAEWVEPGRLIITEAEGVYDALWVDDIIEVTESPKEGWGPLPPLLPKKIFTHTLLINEKIHLYTELRQLVEIEESGILRQYIEKLRDDPEAKEKIATASAAEEQQAEAKESSNTETNPSESEAVTASEQPTSPHNSQVTTTLETDDTIPAADTTDVLPLEQNESETVPATEEEIDLANDEEAVAHPDPPADEQADEPESMPLDSDEEEHEEFKAKTLTPEPDIEETGTQTINNETGTIHSAAIEAEQSTETPVITEATSIETPAPQSEPVYRKTETDERFSNDNEPVIPLVMDEHALNIPPATIDSRSPQNTSSSKSTYIIVIAVVITMLGIAGAIYYLFPSSNSLPTSSEVRKNTTPTQTHSTPEHNSHDAVSVDTAKEHTILVAEEPAPAVKPEKEYRAEIQPDKEGVTIVLHAPKGETPLRKEMETKQQPVTTKKTNEQKAEKKRKQSSKTQAQREVIHIVVKGDTLWDIAEHYVKDPFRYPELAKLSKIRNPDLIYPGNRVRIIDNNHR